MTLAELIDMAVAAKGSRRNVAIGLHQSPQRLTDWKAGTRKPDAHEIAYLAETAGLPILETVADIESQLDERYASIWRTALGKLKAAGVAAAIAVSMVTPQDEAMASPLTSQVSGAALYIMSTIARTLRRLSCSVIKCLRLRPKALACI